MLKTSNMISTYFPTYNKIHIKALHVLAWISHHRSKTNQFIPFEYVHFVYWYPLLMFGLANFKNSSIAFVIKHKTAELSILGYVVYFDCWKNTCIGYINFINSFFFLCGKLNQVFRWQVAILPLRYYTVQLTRHMVKHCHSIVIGQGVKWSTIKLLTFAIIGCFLRVTCQPFVIRNIFN